MDLWARCLWEAYVLARGNRAAELRGDRRAKAFDTTGLHPYSQLWGSVYACEQLLPGLADLRFTGEPECTPYGMKDMAVADANASFVAELEATGGEGVFA